LGRATFINTDYLDKTRE